MSRKKLKWFVADRMDDLDEAMHRRGWCPRWLCDMKEVRYGVPGEYGRIPRAYGRWLYGQDYYPNYGRRDAGRE